MNRQPNLWKPRDDVLTEGEVWTGVLSDLPDEWLELDMVSVDVGTANAVVRTPEGLSTAHVGDYIARGTQAGEFYPVKRAIWQAKYERVQP